MTYEQRRRLGWITDRPGAIERAATIVRRYARAHGAAPDNDRNVVYDILADLRAWMSAMSIADHPEATQWDNIADEVAADLGVELVDEDED